MTFLVGALAVLSILVGFGLMLVRRPDSFLYTTVALAFLTVGWTLLVITLTGGLHNEVF